jgi:hypothetical protein
VGGARLPGSARRGGRAVAREGRVHRATRRSVDRAGAPSRPRLARPGPFRGGAGGVPSAVALNAALSGDHACRRPARASCGRSCGWGDRGRARGARRRDRHRARSRRDAHRCRRDRARRRRPKPRWSGWSR